MVYFLMGCFFVNAVYHYFLFLFYRKNYTALFFALINTTAFGFNMLHIFSTPYDQKIGTLVFILNPLFFFYFVKSMFKEEFYVNFDRFYTCLSIIIFAGITIIPNSYYKTHYIVFNRFVFVLIILFTLYILPILIKAVKHKREDSILIFSGIGILLLFTFVRYLLKDTFVRIPNPVGALFLMLFYSLTLARRFATSHYKCEEVVQQRTKELYDANETLKKLAITDDLTQLYNRRYFFETAEAFVKSAERNNRDISLIIMDADHFKDINDSYGHSVGDTVLKKISSLIKENIRTSDTAARYGGEEFVIILPETDVEGAKVFSDKIRNAVCNAVFLNKKRKN